MFFWSLGKQGINHGGNQSYLIYISADRETAYSESVQSEKSLFQHQRRQRNCWFVISTEIETTDSQYFVKENQFSRQNFVCV
jgi:hypothetical protein